MDILDLGYSLLPQDFVPKEAQADNGKFNDEMRPEPFAR